VNRHRSRLWLEALAVTGLVALTVAFFWRIALTNRILAGVDVFAYFYPYRDYVSETLRSGQLPLWNPYLFMGAPLLANSQAAVLYPLHWPLIWLSAPKQIAWSIVLHIVLAGTGTYLFCRHVVRLGREGAWSGALVFALGGFLGAQAEHVNQLNASAWLPWLLLCLNLSLAPGGHRGLGLLGGGLVIGLSLLAGHMQASYIVIAGGLVYAVLIGYRSFRERRGRRRWASLRGLGAITGMSLLGVALAAAQLLPTLELSRLSIRSGGLSYSEAASFSLSPGLVPKALLPPFLWEPPFSEYVAYVGIVGLALAGAGIWVTFHRPRSASDTRESMRSGENARSRRFQAKVMVALAILGLLLAFGAYNPVYYLLYKVVPGFNLFRAPARWLLLYGFSMSVLCGIGLDSLRGLGAWANRAVVGLLVIELFLASRPLAHNMPTAPAAFDSLRTAPAHLLADRDVQPFRFLSMSDMQFDPGDMGDLQEMYGVAMTAESVYELIVASKMKEVLAYNLPLGYRLYSVDGYDGGLLPTASYATLERLFLPEDQIWSDGRLRQQLEEIPPNRLLSLLNIKYIITDKLRDVWINDIYYDLQHTVPLGEVTLDGLLGFEATHLGIISYLSGANHVQQGMPVAEISVRSDNGIEFSTVLRAGVDTAEGRFESDPVAHQKARVGHEWAQTADGANGYDYVSVLEFGEVMRPAQITVRSLLPAAYGQAVRLRGVTLIDKRSSTSRNVSVHPSYRLVHSGDVKVYENLDLLPRAFVASEARLAADEEDALSQLAAPDFDPTRQVILSQGSEESVESGPATVELLRYDPECVELSVTLGSPGHLVLSDAYYPGWRAEIDGQPATIQQADLYFRAVALDAGVHRVVFYYRPLIVRLGLALTLGSVAGWTVAVVIAARRIGRKSPTRV
jgi:hypothetical protein